jgi:hypothetical protein
MKHQLVLDQKLWVFQDDLSFSLQPSLKQLFVGVMFFILRTKALEIDVLLSPDFRLKIYVVHQMEKIKIIVIETKSFAKVSDCIDCKAPKNTIHH